MEPQPKVWIAKAVVLDLLDYTGSAIMLDLDHTVE